MEGSHGALLRGLTGIASQGVNACGGFLITLFLARVLSVSEFGEFSLLYVLLFLLQTPVMALVCEPMLAFSSTHYAHHWRRDITQSFHLTLLLSSAIAVAFAMAGIAVVPHWPIFGAAFALPAVCLYTTVRIGYFARNLQRYALAGDIAYLTFGLGGLFLCSQFKTITPQVAFIIIATANIAAGVLGIWNDPFRRAVIFGRSDGITKLILENWRYARWLIGYHAVNWAMQSGAIPIAGAIIGIEAAGGLRTLQALAQPYIQLVASLTLLSIPAGTRRLVEHGEDSFNRFIGLLAMGGVLSAAVYYLALEVFAHSFMDVLFPPIYLDYVFLLPYLGASLILQALVAAMSVYCRGYQTTSVMFGATAAAGATTLGGGYLLSRAWGLEGLGTSMVLAALANLAVLMLAFRSHTPKAGFAPPSGTGRSEAA